MSNIVEAFSLSHAQILDGAQSFLEASLAGATDEALDIYGVNDGSLEPDTDSYDNEGDDAVLSTWEWLNFAEVAVQAGYLSLPLVANMTGQELETTEGGAAQSEVQSITVTATGGTYRLTLNGETTTALAFNATASAVATALEALDSVPAGSVVGGGGPGGTGPITLTFGGPLANTPIAQIAADGSLLTGPASDVTTEVTTQGQTATIDSVGLDLWHEDSMNVARRPMILRMPSKDHLGAVRTLTIGLYTVSFKPITFDGPSYKEGLKVNYGGKALMSTVDERGVAFADGKKRVGRLLSHA